MNATTTKTAQVDGLRLAYRELGDGPPVLLLHGWPTSSLLARFFAPGRQNSIR